jgi:excinuclease UvrABC nuclease subunit
MMELKLSLKTILNYLTLWPIFKNVSHSFAISQFRKRKEKGIFTTTLDGIKGLGPKTMANLIQGFASLDALKQAPIAENYENCETRSNRNCHSRNSK